MSDTKTKISVQWKDLFLFLVIFSFILVLEINVEVLCRLLLPFFVP